MALFLSFPPDSLVVITDGGTLGATPILALCTCSAVAQASSQDSFSPSSSYEIRLEHLNKTLIWARNNRRKIEMHHIRSYDLQGAAYLALAYEGP